MNAPKRLKIRLPLNAPSHFDINSIIPIFHRWIQEQTVPGVLIDVADYKHVPNGPGIFLIGDEGDYSLEEVDGHFNFVYDRKRQMGDDLSESIRLVIETARAAGQALEAEAGLGLTVADEVAEVAILDRLNYPNNVETFAHIRHSVADEAASAYGQPNVKLTYAASDHRRPLTFKISVERKLVIA